MAVPTVSSSSDTSINIAWAALSSPANGNSAITAYNVYWDNGNATGTTSISLLQGLATTYTVSGLTGGSTYRFKVRALNVYGAGAFSTELSVQAIDVPSQVAVPTVALSTTNIRVTWTQPNTHSSAVDLYEILFKKADATYVAINATCDGATSAIATAKLCDTPMATIITTTGFSRGTLVQAKVRAHNAKGWGAYSEINTAGATVAVAPAAMATPTEGAATSTTQVQANWAALTTAAQTGGSAITSYNLDWDQGTGTWAEVVGVASAFTALTHTKTSGFTAGSTYKFRVRAKNIFGWGPYSGNLTVVPASVPATMAAVTVAVDNVYAKISWTQPAINGATITAYKIVIAQSDGTTYTESTTYCDGTDSGILAQKYCLVPMSALTASPYSLARGTLVKAKAQAQNSKGWSTLSAANTAGASVQTPPDKMAVPTSGGSLSETQVSVSWAALTSPTNGDSTILSYNLQWDNNTNGSNWYDLIGASPDSVALTYTKSTGISAGTTYKFKVRARNVHGWGVFSDAVSISATGVPY